MFKTTNQIYFTPKSAMETICSWFSSKNQLYPNESENMPVP
jgi:hypothetical protein